MNQITTHPTAIIICALIAFFLIVGICRKCFTRYGKNLTWLHAIMQLPAQIITLFLYKIRKVGFENVPEKGGAILIINHLTYFDVVIISMAFPRPIRFMSWSGFEGFGFMGFIMRGMNTIPVSAANARTALKKAEEVLKNGEIIGIFPEGGMSRLNSLMAFKPGFERLATKMRVPVIPMATDGLWHSIFSNRFKRYIWKMPELRRLNITLNVGKPFFMGENYPAGTLVKNRFEARQTILELQHDAFAMRPVLQNTHLMDVFISACAKHPFKTAVIDYSLERKPFSRGIIAAVSYCLSKRIRKEVPEHRVGIVMPAGAPGMIANYAVSLADKIPVNLNFTLGKAQIDSCIERAKISTMISMAPVKNLIQNRLPDFPWSDHEIDILSWIKECKKSEIILALLQLILLPGWLLKRLWKIQTHGGNDEVALLFTSGSSGMPKGAVITHRNVIANIMQIDDYEIVPQFERNMLCNLPIFHCFGFLTLLWCPPMLDIVAVATPSPLDYTKNIQAIARDKVSIMISTPTFFRGYMKKASAEDLKSVIYVVAGAEKTPAGFDELWCKKFTNSTYLNGYGMTEATPIVAIQRPDVKIKRTNEIQPGLKPGSVGIVFPGMCAKVLNPDTGERCAPNEAGMLYLKGPNIIAGYLNDDGVPVPAADKDGWYKTGDIAELDEFDFITIRGRLARFSKIGGEMVPHGSIEEAIVDLLSLGEEELKIAISARADDAKGEQIVLISAIPDLKLDELNKRLSEEKHLANLWLPRDICYVDAIPVLGTGKLDIKGCATLAAKKA